MLPSLFSISACTCETSCGERSDTDSLPDHQWSLEPGGTAITELWSGVLGAGTIGFIRLLVFKRHIETQTDNPSARWCVYWAGQKSSLRFSTPSYRKTPMDFLANSILKRYVTYWGCRNAGFGRWEDEGNLIQASTGKGGTQWSSEERSPRKDDPELSTTTEPGLSGVTYSWQ